MQTAKTSYTACLIIIGNEILSGRTQDKNIQYIASGLNDAGVKLSEVRVIPDINQTIINTVKSCSELFDYVFTTGGIGPTHDDITSEAIAQAFSVPLERNKEAEAILEKHYGREKLNAARLKMADIPAGAKLIYNPVSAAPGFIISNIYVMAGVPGIMQAMFDSIKGKLRGGAKTLSKTISVYMTEGYIAEGMASIQNKYPNVEIGSYPFIKNQKLGTSLVCRATDPQMLDSCYAELKTFLMGFKSEIEEE